MPERSTSALEGIKVTPGATFKISPDLDHPRKPHERLGYHPAYSELDSVHLDLSELFEGRPIIGTITISEFSPEDEHGTFLTPSGRNKGRLPIHVKV